MIFAAKITLFHSFKSTIMSTTATARMTTKEIAKGLKKLCDKGDFEGAQRELFADDAVSIEAQAAGGFEKETHGLQAIVEKGKKWNDMVSEVHGIEISEPMLAG